MILPLGLVFSGLIDALILGTELCSCQISRVELPLHCCHLNSGLTFEEDERMGERMMTGVMMAVCLQRRSHQDVCSLLGGAELLVRGEHLLEEWVEEPDCVGEASAVCSSSSWAQTKLAWYPPLPLGPRAPHCMSNLPCCASQACCPQSRSCLTGSRRGEGPFPGLRRGQKG